MGVFTEQNRTNIGNEQTYFRHFYWGILFNWTVEVGISISGEEEAHSRYLLAVYDE